MQRLIYRMIFPATGGLSEQRYKRSPGYYGYHRHWPPPPDCWPPPPPRDYWPPPPGPPPGPPPRPPGPPEPLSSDRSESAPYSRYSSEPCNDGCGGKSSGSGSISNAKSETGDAIAVAIASAKKQWKLLIVLCFKFVCWNVLWFQLLIIVKWYVVTTMQLKIAFGYRW